MAATQQRSVLSARPSAWVLTLAVLTPLAFTSHVHADSAAREEKREHLLAVGVRAGFIPPVFVVGEFLVRPVPHIAVGLFGLAIPANYTLGGELTVELWAPGCSTPYVKAELARYWETGDYWHRYTLGYVTAGYLWKLESGVIENEDLIQNHLCLQCDLAYCHRPDQGGSVYG